MRHAWFMKSVEFIKGLADQDGNFLEDDEAKGYCIEDYNRLCGDTEDGLVDQDGNFLEDDEAKGYCIEDYNRLCGDTEDGNFIKGLDETINQKSNRMSVEERDGVLDSEGDGVHLSQTNDVIQQVDHFDDDYMLMLNDEEKPVKSSLNDTELEQEPDKFADKLGILEQQPNDAKGKTIVSKENLEVRVKEKPSLGTDLAPRQVKKKKCQRALRPNYVLRSAQQLDLWVDQMWSLRLPEADWAMVYFLVNEPKKHWCLVELEIHNRVVTFYDSFGWAGGNKRRWWRQMTKLLPKKLTVYLLMHGIFESKGISADSYNITYKYDAAPFQAALFGDCGILDVVIEAPYKQRKINGTFEEVML
nr:phospholipase-like protein [Tanacetum cinerariifolium]